MWFFFSSTSSLLRSKKSLKFWGGLFVLGVWPFAPVLAAGVFDTAVGDQDVSFQPVEAIVGQPVKVYVTVQNQGERDVEGTIVLYDGTTRIGSKPFSSRAQGRPDEVWMQWQPERLGEHELRVEVVNDPEFTDANPQNNRWSITKYVDRDSDGDGFPNRLDPDDDNDTVPDELDDFPQDPTRWKDTDKDGIDDNLDTDDDNDGLSDQEERVLGTNPLKFDTDGDGVGDKEDAFPLDPKRSKLETPKPIPATAPSNTPVPAATKTAPPTVPAPKPNAAPSPVSPRIAPVTNQSENLEIGQVTIGTVTSGMALDSGQATNTQAVTSSSSPDVPTAPIAAVVDVAPPARESSSLPWLWTATTVSAALGGAFWWLSIRKG